MQEISWAEYYGETVKCDGCRRKVLLQPFKGYEFVDEIHGSDFIFCSKECMIRVLKKYHNFKQTRIIPMGEWLRE